MLRRLAMLAGSTLAAGLLMAAPALAAPAQAAVTAHTQASPRACEAGYHTIENQDGYWLEGFSNDSVLLTTDSGYCWRSAGFNDTAPITTESGKCLGFNSSLGYVVLQTGACNASWDEWTVSEVESGAIVYENQWGADHGYAADLCGQGDGLAVTITGYCSTNLIGWHTYS